MNRITFPFLTILCILLFSANAYSQVFRPGFIVQAEGDTIQGLVKYREGTINYTGCIFKTTKESEAKEYFSKDIIAYSIKNEALFESKNITTEKGDSLATFIETLVHGNLNLYRYKNLFFLEKEKGNLKLLHLQVHDPGLGGVIGETRVVTTLPQHLILINSLTFDCPVPEELLSKIKIRLYIADVTAVVEAYNNCMKPNSSLAYKADKAWIAIDKGILIGSHSTTLKFKSGPNSMEDATYATMNNIVFGAHFNIRSPKRTEKFSLQLEAIYSKEKHLGYLEQQELATIHKNDFHIDINRLSIVPVARYSFITNNRLSPYFGIGIANDLILNAKVERRRESITPINDIRQIETYVTEAYLAKHYIAPTAAIGTSYHLSDKYVMLLQLRYENGHYTTWDTIEKPALTAQIEKYKNHNFYFTAAFILK